MNASTGSRFTRDDFAVLAFTAAYMAVALIASFSLRNSEFLFYFVVMLVLIAAVAALHRTNHLHMGAL